MSEIRYHIELFNGDLTKVVFEDGYTPYQNGKSVVEALQSLREFRASQPPHDLSVLRRKVRPVARIEQEAEVQEKPAKKSKRSKVSDDE